MAIESELLRVASFIDPDRAGELAKELGQTGPSALAVLLGTAYPALLPSFPWQRAALATLLTQGWRGQRRRRSLMSAFARILRTAADAEQGMVELRRAVWVEKTRIALRELLPVSLGGAGIQTTAHELSDLADSAVEAGLWEAERCLKERFGEPRLANGRPSKLVVLGLGKLGGQELNAGSDIDILFIYDSDEGGSRLSLHDHFTRVTQRLVTHLEAPSPDGLIWRVDLRLRPEGSQGSLVNSLSATERYYETWGRLWERAALLRSRPIAGDRVLGELFVREVAQPFVYRREVHPSIALGLAELVERSRIELSREPDRDLKLGPGGIREAEFFVQTLQLIWGGQEPSLRVPGTLPALNRLRSRGLVNDREVSIIARSYTLLRRIEHWVQWSSGLQTQILPSSAAELGRLARSLGFADEYALCAELESTRAEVSTLFASLLPSAPRPSKRYGPLVSLLGAPSSEFTELSEQVFHTSDVAEHLLYLARRPDNLLGVLTRERFPDLCEQVFDAIASSPDPEQAARYLRWFFGRFYAPHAYIGALGENPRALQRLVTTLGSSAFVGDALLSRPDLADVVLFGDGGLCEPSAAVALELESYERLKQTLDPYEREERFITALRLAKSRVTVEVSVLDLAGAIGTRDATRLLSDLADEQLRRALEYELGPHPRGFAIIAMGKLGGRDIGYASDLDLLFLYDPGALLNPEEGSAYYARLAQRIIRLVSGLNAAGPGYELDTRLRPSGSHGMLVTSLSAFARYHRVPLEIQREISAEGAPHSTGAAWERQALLRARPCAGDPELCAQAIEVATHAAYQAGAPPAQEVYRLRLRMERELGRERPGRYDLKTGCGGLLDIEFASQWLQMQHGRDESVRTPDTLEAVEALHAGGHLALRDFEAFREGYRFLRRLEQRIHVFQGKGSTTFDAEGPGLPQLARRMGFHHASPEQSASELVARYCDVTKTVRAAYERVLGP